MRTCHLSRLVVIALVIAAACVEPYPAPDVAQDLNILVVDGFVNGSDGLATVRLSHTTKLNEDEGLVAEEGASVVVKTNAGDSFVLAEMDSGNYRIDGMTLDPAKQYQLHIRTNDGQEYISDYVSIKNTPPIDSVTWRPDGDGISVMVNTHDQTGASKYYRWDYVETWEYHAPFLSAYKLQDGEVVYRQPHELVFECYNTVPSTTILVGSSLRLGEDVIRDFPLIYIPRVSSRLSVMYSILVHQRVIEKAEYEFWLDLQEVTESVGGLFDSQPYEILGNVHNVNNPSAPVLGYFSAGYVTQTRIFIDYLKLPEPLRKRPYHGCFYDTICLYRGPTTPYKCSNDVPNLPPNAHLVAPLFNGPTIWGYTMGSPDCADCREEGGVLTKPDFWP